MVELTLKPSEFTFFSDPGHGWLKVKKDLLEKLNIHNDVTSYSYMKGDFAYLEEDCDVTLFYNALITSGMSELDVKQLFQSMEQKHTDRTSAIRRYESYRP